MGFSGQAGRAKPGLRPGRGDETGGAVRRRLAPPSGNWGDLRGSRFPWTVLPPRRHTAPVHRHDQVAGGTRENGKSVRTGGSAAGPGRSTDPVIHASLRGFPQTILPQRTSSGWAGTGGPDQPCDRGGRWLGRDRARRLPGAGRAGVTGPGWRSATGDRRPGRGPASSAGGVGGYAHDKGAVSPHSSSTRFANTSRFFGAT